MQLSVAPEVWARRTDSGAISLGCVSPLASSPNEPAVTCDTGEYFKPRRGDSEVWMPMPSHTVPAYQTLYNTSNVTAIGRRIWLRKLHPPRLQRTLAPAARAGDDGGPGRGAELRGRGGGGGGEGAGRASSAPSNGGAHERRRHVSRLQRAAAAGDAAPQPLPVQHAGSPAKWHLNNECVVGLLCRANIYFAEHNLYYSEIKLSSIPVRIGGFLTASHKPSSRVRSHSCTHRHQILYSLTF